MNPSPGPWFWTENSREVYPPLLMAPETAELSEGCVGVQLTDFAAQKQHKDYIQANMAIIALAPEMREMLLDLFNHHEYGPTARDFEGVDEWPALAARLRALRDRLK